MLRNLSHRVEIAFPVRDPVCKAQVLKILEFQLADNRKARRLETGSHHRYVSRDGSPVRARAAIRSWLEDAYASSRRRPVPTG